MKLFIYNFHGEIIESNEAFPAHVRAKIRECEANGEPMSRQVIDGDKIINEKRFNGIWLMAD